APSPRVRAAPRIPISSRRRPTLLALLLQWQLDDEARALAHGPVRLDAAVVPLDDLAHDREPDSAACELRSTVQALERHEDPLAVALFEADAVVAHADPDPAPLVGDGIAADGL